MKKTFYLILVVLLMIATMRAQSIIVPKNLNGTADLPLTWLSDFITADTNANGTQKNKVYLLQPGELYVFTSQVVWRSDITIKSNGKPTDPRPIIFRINKTGGSTLAPMYRGFGSLTLDGLYVIQGDEGPLAAAYTTNPMIGFGKGKTYSILNCVMIKNRQAILRIEADSSKAIVEGNHIYNLGDYGGLQGNGRIVDPRNSNMDSIIIRNNIIHNILDRLYIGFRQTGLNYINFSNNTVFNHVGRHGLFQVGKRTKEVVFNNNLIINPSIIGTNKFLADEQFAPHVREQNYLFTIDSLPTTGSKISMKNNNITYTSDVLNHYTSFKDSISKPLFYSPAFEKLINPATASFDEVIELNNVPRRDSLIKYARNAILTRATSGITNIMVEDITLKGTDYEKGRLLFDFAKFDGCYSKTSKSYTAASDGKAVGARWPCGLTLTNTKEQFNAYISLEAAPNPVGNNTKLTFINQTAGPVSFTLVDFQGKMISKTQEQFMNEGENSYNWERSGNIPAGLYYMVVNTEKGKMFTKLFLQ
jgi:hypothetical protein